MRWRSERGCMWHIWQMAWGDWGCFASTFYQRITLAFQVVMQLLRFPLSEKFSCPEELSYSLRFHLSCDLDQITLRMSL